MGTLDGKGKESLNVEHHDPPGQQTIKGNAILFLFPPGSAHMLYRACTHVAYFQQTPLLKKTLFRTKMKKKETGWLRRLGQRHHFCPG
jgi:hypothetical protein